MKTYKTWMAVTVALIALCTGQAWGTATQKAYTWNGGAGDGNWFNADNWTGPDGSPALPGTTHNPAAEIIDGAFFAAASNVTGTINYTPGTPTVFDHLAINKTDATPLTFNVNGDMTVSYYEGEGQGDATYYYYRTAAQLGDGGNLVFNVNSGTVAMGNAGHFYIKLAQFNVAPGAAFIAFANTVGNNRQVHLTVADSARIQGWFGNNANSIECSPRNNGLRFLGGAMNVDGGTLYPDYLDQLQGTALNVTNGGTLRVRYGSYGIRMYGGQVNADYANTLTLEHSGIVTNVETLRIAGHNSGYPAKSGLSTVTVNGGTWFQGGATCVGDGREGRLIIKGGQFDTPADLYVGGGRLAAAETAPSGVAYQGTLTIDGGTLVVSNPDAMNPHTATAEGAFKFNSVLYFEQPSAGWDFTYRGQRVVFSDLKTGGAGLQKDRIYHVTEVSAAGATWYKYRFGVEADMTLTGSGLTGTSYATGTGANTYYTLPARLMVGNAMTFSGPTTLMNTGTVNLVSGTLTVDALVATNGAASILNFAGGTLSTAATTVDTGSLLAFGDGVSAAVLNLDGGTHAFADGLAINANAALRVAGTNAIGSATIDGDLTLNAGAVLDWVFNETTQDALSVSGTVTLPASATVVLRSLDASAPETIPLLTAAGGFAGSSTAGWPTVYVGDSRYRAAIDGNTLQMGRVALGCIISIR